MTTQTKIKSCPFCSAEDLCIRNEYNVVWRYFVRCEKCGALGPIFFMESVRTNDGTEQAIKLWNKAPRKGEG
jgi:hypothetical protein